jgi:hypothetical protein
VSIEDGLSLELKEQFNSRGANVETYAWLTHEDAPGYEIRAQLKYDNTLEMSFKSQSVTNKLSGQVNNGESGKLFCNIALSFR